ncbi:MAG: DNA polymerase III subunit delta [Clostridium sp.]|nr:DNA polymerase III subunit delta [Clostridium sp.]
MAKKKVTTDVSMKEISRQIESNEMKQFYLLSGSEDYLKLQYRDKLVKALADLEDNMNYNYFEGNHIDLQEVLDLGETLPFFAENRVIVWENSGLFKKAQDNLTDRLEKLPDSTYIIFVEKDLDGRNRLYKWIGEKGYTADLSTPDEKMLGRWVRSLCREEGKQIDEEAVAYFLGHMGSDMLLLKNELEKLFSYKQDSDTINMEDIREICVSQAQDTLFKMLDEVGNHNQQKALLLYHDLLALREPALRILAMLTRHLRILMQISAMTAEGKDNRSLAAASGIPPYFVSKYASQADRYSHKELRNMVERCQEIDHSIKTGRIQGNVGVELLIVEFSR